MIRSRLVLATLVVLAVAACDSGTVSPTTSVPGTSTTIDNDTCSRLAADTARYLETLISVLDQVTLAETRDREQWPEALLAMEEQGRDLDARAEELRCDPGEVQTAAFLAADLDPNSDLSRYLLTLMGR
ncbi:MAG TPA: hypothetical protein VFY15_01950 [Acidimicrobiia bacterium]|nr:hypothetical protein [Acidimicrobiia bacterium]